MSEHKLPHSVMNEVFVNRLDDSADFAEETTLAYVKDRLRDLCPRAVDIKVQVSKQAQVIILSVTGVLDGREMSGSQQWTDMYLLTSDHPITYLIEQVVRRVFEVPSEGTPVS